MGSDVLTAIENFKISDKCFDAEVTAIMGEAFDQACKEMHGKARPSGFKKRIAKRLIDIAGVASAAPRKCAKLP